MDRKGKMDFLITGSSGFIGKNLQQMASLVGMKYGTLDISGDPEIIADIRDVDWESVGLEKYDCVVHLAAKISVAESFEIPNFYEEVNVIATERLFQACVKAKVKKVIFASSAAVYGSSDSKYKQIGQENPATSPYALTKLDGERIAFDLSSLQTRFLCLRFFNVYGMGQNSNSQYASVISDFISRMSAGLPVSIHGDGLQSRDFIHVDDVSKIILLGHETETPPFHIVNVGTGIGNSIINLHNLLSKIFHNEGIATTKAVFCGPREGDIRHSIADISGLKEWVGNHNFISLERGLKDLVKRTLDESDA